MKLPDAGRLAFTDCGDPDGSVVMCFHETPTRRLDLPFG